MLEVKNLKKIYKTKNGADVHALDGVTLRFPETGMVFLLGKSGSGKSTLLNVCGGLDSPSEGEVIVKGRSSKDFSQSDFDSYRNTFVGFIFQEYNILNEFTVEDNIALALELQGKPKDKAAINALLKEVDLEGFAKRKPNTLSGGQKQRIAIARALVKAPEIIMADEPTGALDSKTGKQVFDTLKKLSRDKLVIVVSHDREFAEQYGDRIIELMDGKVLEDVSKTELQQQAISTNVNTVGDVLCVKRGSELTDRDFDEIKAFLKRSDDDVIIANNPKDVENFKKVSMINDKGEKEVFRETEISDDIKQYTKEDNRFIRSKLPLRHAFKIGVSGLKSKPVRLFFTILLCTVAFVLFGLLSTLNFYDSEAAFRQTMMDTDNSVMQLKKEYKANVTWYTNGEADFTHEAIYDAKFSDSDLKGYAVTLGKDTFGAVSSFTSFNVRNAQAAYWVNSITAFAYLEDGNAIRANINGTYPKSKNEIAITTYAAEMLKTCDGYDSEGKALSLGIPTDIIGKKILLNGTAYTVTGIIDSGVVPSEYESLKDAETDDYALTREFESYISDGLHLLVFVNRERLELCGAEMFSQTESFSDYTYCTSALKINGEYEFPEWNNFNYTTLSEAGGGNNLKFVGAEKSAPSDNEVFISDKGFASLVNKRYRLLIEDAYSREDYTSAERYQKISELCSMVEMGGKYEKPEDGEKENFVAYSDEEIAKLIDEIITGVKKDNVSLKLGLKPFDVYNQVAIGEPFEFDIVAVYTVASTDKLRGFSVAVSDKVFDDIWEIHKDFIPSYSVSESVYKDSPDAVYSILYAPYEYSDSAVDTYWALYNNDKYNDDNSKVNLTGNFIGTLKTVDEMVESMSKIFLYVGLGFALFAILLFSNFISVSISQKRREIGILRAVGARSADVFKIFFSESFVIAAICIVISTALCAFLCNLLNNIVGAEIGASIFLFGIASFAILVGVALLTAVIATFLPVFNAAKKKPVDSIRAI